MESLYAASDDLLARRARNYCRHFRDCSHSGHGPRRCGNRLWARDEDARQAAGRGRCRGDRGPHHEGEHHWHRQAIGTAVFQANQPAGVSSTVTVQANNKEATVSASSSLETSLLKVLQIPRTEVASLAKAVRTKYGRPPSALASSKTASPAIDISEMRT
jgi:hypothetical protein